MHTSKPLLNVIYMLFMHMDITAHYNETQTVNLKMAKVT